MPEQFLSALVSMSLALSLILSSSESIPVTPLFVVVTFYFDTVNHVTGYNQGLNSLFILDFRDAASLTSIKLIKLPYILSCIIQQNMSKSFSHAFHSFDVSSEVRLVV